MNSPLLLLSAIARVLAHRLLKGHPPPAGAPAAAASRPAPAPGWSWSYELRQLPLEGVVTILPTLVLRRRGREKLIPLSNAGPLWAAYHPCPN